MLNLPVYIPVIFILTVLLTVGIFYKASGYSKITLLILLAWLLIQGLVGASGFYTNTNSIPPRFALLGLPPMIVIILLFLTKTGKQFIDRLNTGTLTLLHINRVFVELVLYWLFVQKTIPQLMTFEGRNFDILSGLTAPVVYYFGFATKKLNKSVIIIWNILCIGLLINIVINAVLSIPFPFQQFGFDQPNIAVLHFPYIWLPCCIVPLVLFSHLATIRHLLRREVNSIP
jgi:hypothetical protein